MKGFALLAAVLMLITPAHADFSYKTTREATGGTMTQAAGDIDPQVSTYYFKGQKMKVVNQQVATILDFDAHTVTSINNATRSYAVRSFADVNAATKAGDEEVKADSKDTGRKMFLNGFDASDLLITLDVAGIDPWTRRAGKTELHLEADTWLSTNIPGSSEVNDFHRRNAGRFPWAAMGGPDPGEPGLDPLKRRTWVRVVESFLQCFDWIDCGYSESLQAAVSEVRRNMTLKHGVPVRQVVRARNYGGADSGAADQWLAEVTMESSDFSTREISPSEFAIPDGYAVGAAPLINLSLLSAPRLSNSTGAGQVPAANSLAVPALSLTKRVDAEYSREARAAGLQGTVLLLLEVTPEGTVHDVRVRRALGMGLDERAVAAAKQWQYKPFDANGRSMTEVVEVPFQVEPRGPWRMVGSKFSFLPMKGLQVKPVLSEYVSPAAAACPKDMVYVPVELTVGSDGTPNDVRVGSTIEDSIGKAAIDAVRSWKFSPATVAGQAEANSGTILLECRAPGTSVSTDTGTSRVGGGVSQPSVIFKVDPDYSEEARRAKYSGTMALSVIVDTEGHARDIRIVKTLGMGLDQEAVIAVNQWRFKPGMKGGQPVNIRATIEVNFRLL